MTDTGTQTDAELVARAAAGSDAAFRALYRRYAKPVYWLAHRLVGTSTDAEDVTQETFVAAWRKLGALELTGESALPWLSTICRFQAANRIRRQQRDRAHTSDALDEALPSTVDVERQVIDDEYFRAIAAQIATLSETDREVFRLCAVEGFGYQAAADHLGLGHGAVRNRLSRIRTQLRTTAKEDA
ncbi:sigma-70 family RNA polymerase sigma factor [Microbacterium sediminicola]|uniref:RNA polymerase sigma factor n=1 Tax=Microbacterium sediminicola TaxID=415210 RepID=A0ABP4TP40_9MICO